MAPHQPLGGVSGEFTVADMPEHPVGVAFRDDRSVPPATEHRDPIVALVSDAIFPYNCGGKGYLVRASAHESI